MIVAEHDKKVLKKSVHKLILKRKIIISKLFSRGEKTIIY